jgi:hypothetical protein
VLSEAAAAGLEEFWVLCAAQGLGASVLGVIPYSVCPLLAAPSSLHLPFWEHGLPLLCSR